MLFETVVPTIREYDERLAAISRDVALSEVGKQQRKLTLANERKAYEGRALAVLEADWNTIRRRYAELNEASKAAYEVAARDWDYQRLLYQRHEAAAFFDRLTTAGALSAQSPLDIAAAHMKNLAAGGDKHELRAFCEEAPAILRGRFASDPAAHMLAQEAEKHLEAVKAHPALDAVKAQKAALVRDAVALRDATRAAQGAFYPPSAGLLLGGTPFGAILNGIKLVETVDVQTLQYVYDLEIGDPDPYKFA